MWGIGIAIGPASVDKHVDVNTLLGDIQGHLEGFSIEGDPDRHFRIAENQQEVRFWLFLNRDAHQAVKARAKTIDDDHGHLMPIYRITEWGDATKTREDMDTYALEMMRGDGPFTHRWMLNPDAVVPSASIVGEFVENN